MAKTTEKFDIEKGFLQVEELLEKMEKDNCSLNELMDMYKEGVGIIGKCNEAVENAEKEMACLMNNEKGFVEVTD